MTAAMGRAAHLIHYGPRALLADWLAWPLVGANAEAILAGYRALMGDQEVPFATWFGARSRLTEDWLAVSGAEQHVILGAGLDSFGWRGAREEQQDRFLGPILSGEEIWCQGFSEPDAGSDLAALKTRAVPDGDDWIVTGQKVWTSGAQHARWCMLVARTDADAPKHKGLTYFLMDMDQAEIQVLPLRQITGEAEFNELFIEGARIPGEQRDRRGGERVEGRADHADERARRPGVLPPGAAAPLLDDLIDEAAARGLLDDDVVADKLGALHVKAEILRLTAYRGLTAIEKYGQPGPEGSLTKWMWSDTNQELTQLAADLLGADALVAGSPGATSCCAPAATRSRAAPPRS